MNSGGTIATTQLIAFVLWLAAVVLLVASWVTWFAGLGSLPFMLAFTTAPLIGAASVFQVRCYTSGICSLMRVVSGLERPDAKIHTMR